MKKFAVYLAVAVAFVGTALHGGTKEDEAAIREMLVSDVKAAQSENLEVAVSHVDEPMRKQVRSMFTQLFEMYDLDYKLLDIKILSVGKDTAKVEVTMETRKRKGPQFRDNRTVVVHTLVRRADGWKFSGSEIRKVEFL